jgi:glycosyltransferase involved in cell wall biosynthesis
LRRGSIEVIPHPSYLGAYPEPPSRETARAELGVSESATMFLCFGGLRRYKGAEIVLDAFDLLQAPDAILMMAGLPVDKDLEERIHRAAARDHRIRFLLELVPEKRVPTLFAAADVAVLPRGDGGTSGALILALGMGVPIIAAESQNVTATTKGGTAAWLFRPGDAESLRACIESAVLNPEMRIEKTHGAAQLGPTLGMSPDDRVRAARAIRGDATPKRARRFGLRRNANRG